MPEAGRLKAAGLILVVLWFSIGGIAHFAVTETEMRIVPPYIARPRITVQATGVFELLGALGIIWVRSRAVAGVGLLLLLLTIAVTPANLYMLQRSDLFAVPYGILVARLPVQPALLGLIAWSTDVTRPFGSAAGPAGRSGS